MVVTYKVSNVLEGHVRHVVLDREVVRGLCGAFEGCMRLQEEVLVVWACDDLVDEGAWLGIEVSVWVAVWAALVLVLIMCSDQGGEEACVVTFGRDHCCDVDFL